MRSDDAVETVKRHSHDEQCTEHDGCEHEDDDQSAVPWLIWGKIHVQNLVEVSTKCCNIK